jgi:hypothetical protein
MYFACFSRITTLRLAPARSHHVFLMRLTLILANAALHALPEKLHGGGKGLAHGDGVQRVPLVGALGVGVVDEDGSVVAVLRPGGDDGVVDVRRDEALGGVEGAGVDWWLSVWRARYRRSSRTDDHLFDVFEVCDGFAVLGMPSGDMVIVLEV